METYDAISTLSALGQITRIEAFRVLLQHEPDGMTESELASSLNLTSDVLAEQLSVLVGAGLASSEHLAHEIVYHARPDRLRELNVFFVKDYRGRFEHCARLVADIVNNMDATSQPKA